MDREHLCDSLIKWLETFSLSRPHHTAEELSTGAAMAELLHQIAPNFFHDQWLSKIKSEDVTNWRLKVSNLKKVLKGIMDYYSDNLGLHIQDFPMPDVSAIGECGDKGELGRLLQLILGCAVNCDDKQEYIQRIMAMEESVQHVVMNAIQELMTKETSTPTDGVTEMAEQLKKTQDLLTSALEEKEELTQRCHELDMQVAVLLEEKTTLVGEAEKLQDRVNQTETLDDPSTPAGRRYQQLQTQVEQQQEELYRLEAGKEDYRAKCEILEKKTTELQQKVTQLSALAEQTQALKDELDIYKHSSEQVAQYEATIQSYKKKLVELSDVKGQVKILQEQNTNYMQQNMVLEEENKKTGPIKQQLEMYKRQMHELQTKLSEETKRADKGEFENKRWQEKMATLQKEKERIMAERDSLREMNEELKCTQFAHGGTEFGDTGESLSTSAEILELVNLHPAVKEKLLRLEHENKLMRLSKGEEEQSQVLQSMLDDANSRKNELETDIRLANQRILTLEAQLEDFHEKQTVTMSSTETIELKKKLHETTQKLAEAESKLATSNTQLTELQASVESGREKTQQLEEKLQKKEDSMRAMEERYKRYLEKAKSVIHTLGPKPGQVTEISSLKSQLAEKDRKLEKLNKEYERTRTMKEQEEKLIVTAWNNMGMQLHRKAAEERLANGGAGQSFLARQRQAHTRKGQTYSTLQNNNAAR
ncbi:LOW QUALITY PROTEIN: protein Hook homolog 3-like [Liolophura sinensis]|uniref:LOW QUALITY PROTEIN: protein Hook homolog 3-like n=1 Tax=Liolophura sinensis TaxID=3198878 RepID=UPI00315854EF